MDTRTLWQIYTRHCTERHFNWLRTPVNALGHLQERNCRVLIYKLGAHKLTQDGGMMEYDKLIDLQ